MGENTTLTIAELRVENVKRIQAFEYKPDGRVVIVGGKNGAGKSSVLDSIAYALGGVKLCPTEPIRRGQKKATVSVDLGEMIVTRIWTEGGSRLEIKNAEGVKYSSPQAILDKLTGNLCFDPLAWCQMEKQKQLDALKGLVGLDFSVQDARRKAMYDQRTEVNREARRLEGQLAGIPVEDVPFDEVSVSDLMAERKRREAVNRAIEEQDREYERLQNTVYRQQDRRVEVSQALADIAPGLMAATEQAYQDMGDAIALARKNYEARCTKLKAEAAAELDKCTKALAAIDASLATVAEQIERVKGRANPGIQNLDEIDRRIADADATNAKVRQMKQRAALVDELREMQAKAASLSNRIEGIDNTKARAMKEAAFPVAGLAFDDSGVTFNSIPFSQASSAEQLRVSVAMGLALNPKLRVILIRDGSLLDEDNLALIGTMAAEHEAQIWVESVTRNKADEAACSVIIENGQVKE